MEAKFSTFYVLPMTPQLKRLQDSIYKEVLQFAKMGQPGLENLADCPELEQFCDCLLLVHSKALEVDYTDSLPDGLGDEGIILKLRLE